MTYHQQLIEEIIQKIDSRRDSYGSILIKSAIMKEKGIWKNIITQFLPLHVSEVYTPKKKLDYGNFVIFESIFSLDKLIKLIKGLPEGAGAESKIMINNYQVQIDGERLENGYKYNSGVDYLNIGWYFERYRYRTRNPGHHSEPLVSPDLPIFPGVHIAIKVLFGIDLERYSDLYGNILVCLPNYGARIDEVIIGSKEIKLKVQTKNEDIKNIVGKLYCQHGEEVKQEDIKFLDQTENVFIGFKPDFFYFALISRGSGEILDTREFHSAWGLPKGISIDIPEYEIIELIRHGETETIEFKEDIGKPEEFAETVVAFANGKGGIILLGVNNNAKIVGLPDRDHEDTITNILRSHCDPPVEYKIDKRQLDGKSIIAIHVSQGKDKPHIVKDKGAYVRANATDRIATRYELDEFYRQKQSGYQPHY